MKTGIFYGSSTGITKEIAKRLAKILEVSTDDIHDVADTAPAAVTPYDFLIFGASTWGAGELQGDWFDFLTGVEELDLKGKTIALFGCGDETMTDTFNNAVGEIYNRMQKTKARFIGSFEASEYSFEKSKAFIDGVFVGLLLDEVNHAEITDQRLNDWVEKLKKEY